MERVSPLPGGGPCFLSFSFSLKFLNALGEQPKNMSKKMSENFSDIGADSIICCAAILLWCVVSKVQIERKNGWKKFQVYFDLQRQGCETREGCLGS